MRLFTKYNRVNIWLTVAIFILGAAGFYLLLSYVLNRQLDDTLRSEQQEITEYVAAYNKLPVFQNTRQQWMTARPATEEQAVPVIDSYRQYNAKNDENEWVRVLRFTVRTGNEFYQVTVNRSQTETEDLLKLIIMLTLGMIGIILLVNYLVNRLLVNKLLTPFYTTVEGIKQYAGVESPMQLLQTGIDEIDILNASVNEMTQRIHTEYKALKTFTENASHEMQTPLAVIRGKIELLLQNETLQQQDIKYILQVDDACKRLARLHQSLLLLTKLENRQFTVTDVVDMLDVVTARAAEFEELFAAKNILLSVQVKPVTIYLHYHLAEILTSNLLNNALRHTPYGGEVFVMLTEQALTVGNTALKDPLDSNSVFRRFYRAEDGTEGTGLGLAIIKEICNIGGLEVEYNFTGGKHVFAVHFQQH